MRSGEVKNTEVRSSPSPIGGITEPAKAGADPGNYEGRGRVHLNA